MNNCIHVVYVRLDLSDDENRHVAASMASVMENTQSNIHFHILYHKPTNDNSILNRVHKNILLFRELTRNYNQEISFHEVDIDPSLSKNPCNYRLFMSEILSDVDVVVSLGYDTIVTLDLNEIFLNFPIEQYSLAGCLDTTFYATYDSWRENVHKYYTEIGISKEQYCNADVLIFNLAKIRDENILPDKVLTFYNTYNTPWLNEQDALNSVFIDDIFHLPQRYNIQSRDEKYIRDLLMISNDKNIEGCILHNKFWNDFLGKVDSLYWYYLSLTPWGSGKQLYYYMSLTMKTPQRIIENIDSYIRSYPHKEIIKLLWSFTIPLYIKLIKIFAHYVKTGHMDYVALKEQPLGR